MSEIDITTDKLSLAPMPPLPSPVRDPAALSIAARRRLQSVWGEPLFVADWLRVLMVHLAVDPACLQRAVPFPLDLRDGRAYVSLVAFTLSDLRPRFGGWLAAQLFRPIATHDFLNVRTYVKVGDEPGIHFLAEWLSNRLAVGLGPRLFALPYRHGVLRYDHDWTRGSLRGCVGDISGKGALRYAARLTSVPAFAHCGADTLDAWLMERYTAFNGVQNRRRFFRVWHAPWQQCAAEVTIEDASLLWTHWPWMRQAQLVGGHFSPGATQVRMGRAHRLGKGTFPSGARVLLA